MDPNANLQEQLRLASKITEAHENERTVHPADAARLAELVVALDEWLRSGGTLPAAWS